MERSPSSPKQAANLPHSESFQEALHAVVGAEFGKYYRLAAVLGVSKSQIAHYVQEPEKLQGKTLDRLLAVVESDVLRMRLYRAWSRQFEPLPLLDPQTSIGGVIVQLDALIAGGLTTRAIALAKRELRTRQDFPEWFLITQRLVPFYLRHGYVSEALQLQKRVAERSLAEKNFAALAAARAMQENALHSLDEATPALFDTIHRKTMAALDVWTPKTPAERRDRDLRIANMRREKALHIYHFVNRRKLPPSALDAARQEMQSAIRDDFPDYMIALGLEVRARLEIAAGDVLRAEGTLEDLEAFGLEKGWELWEKSRLDLARIAQLRGKQDEALEILTSVRDYSRASGNLHHARSADQALAHILLLSDE